MKDSTVTDVNTGKTYIVGTMPLGLIQEILGGGVPVELAPGELGSVDGFIERLRIELVARGLEGRL